MKVRTDMGWIEQIKRYKPYNKQEKKDKELILFCIDAFNDILTRDNKIAHITSSAFVVNKTKDKMLMIHHNIYDSWSWTGGHADGEEDLLAVAIKEATEEAGVKNIQPVTMDIFALDILSVLGHMKSGKYVSAHIHLSVAYICEADENETLVFKADENSDVKWIPISDLPKVSKTICRDDLAQLVEWLAEKDDTIRYQSFLLLQQRALHFAYENSQ